MVDFITIKEAKEAKKGSITACVTHISELKAGTSKDGKDWTRKTIALQDKTDEVKLTVWNDEIPQFEKGGVFQIENPWWKEHEGNLSLSLGKYAVVKKITDDVSSYTAPTATSEPEEEKEPLPAITEMFVEKIQAETIILLQIEQVVRNVMKLYTNDINDQKVGMFVKEIYRTTQKSNLMRASEIK